MRTMLQITLLTAIFAGCSAPQPIPALNSPLEVPSTAMVATKQNP